MDEVGQYIAEHTKLMTNLQTIAESLATKCKGRAWIIVTAQEDMDTVIGDMNQQKSNDFTKIQARFKNRMKLTSQPYSVLTPSSGSGSELDHSGGAVCALRVRASCVLGKPQN